jgi:hypothetical protein
MIEKRTVFVLGAGASCPYEFPTARELRTRIIKDFVGQYTEYIRESQPRPHDKRTAFLASRAKDSAEMFVSAFHLSSTESIDLFLSRQPQFKEIGKTAICLSILGAERLSHFREDLDHRECDWYFFLYNMLTRKATGKEGYLRFGENPIAFVTFNYDRSLEHFLFDSLRHSFEAVDEAKAKQQLDAIPIIHVYGKPAPLPWELTDGEAVLEYGEQIKRLVSIDLPTVINNLHVVHEERVNPELEKARKEIRKAERIFFLGFGYADENLDALGIPDGLGAGHEIYGTAMGWTKKERHDIQSRFAAGLKKAGNIYGRNQVQIWDCDCVSLLREFL